jgi:hypothetical protein
MPSLAKPLIMQAVSEAPSARAWREAAVSPRVMHVFERAANLVDDEAGVLSLVAHPMGAGPFTIVIQPVRPVALARPRLTDWLDMESSVRIETGQLIAGRLHVLTKDANLWDPGLPWQELQGQRDRILVSRGLLRHLLGTSAPPGGLAQLFEDDLASAAQSGDLAGAVLMRARGPARELALALAARDGERAVEAAGRLAGLGGGLTPSGDDFIIGTMYAVRLFADATWAQDIALRLVETAGPRTARISQAWLEAAARGEASLMWHRLFEAILGGDSPRIESATLDLLRVGHTSGADALTGFLMGLDAFAD